MVRLMDNDRGDLPWVKVVAWVILMMAINALRGDSIDLCKGGSGA
jgi:hypothetical protein